MRDQVHIQTISGRGLLENGKQFQVIINQSCILHILGAFHRLFLLLFKDGHLMPQVILHELSYEIQLQDFFQQSFN